MGRHCKKCGYERQEGDNAPGYECPKCGAVYAKVEARLKHESEVTLQRRAKEKAERQEAGERKFLEQDKKAQNQRLRRIPMGYVESNLSPNERILAKGKIHWFVFVPGSVLMLIGFLFFGQAEPASILIGVVLIFFAFFMLLKAAIVVLSTELAVTTKRVVAKFGLISRRTVELNNTKVESFNVDQSIFGRFLGFGTLTINGTGGARTPIPSITNPLEFRRIATEQIESIQE